MAGKGRIENLKPWRKGQSGNPKGRPKKLVSSLLSELQKEGYAGTTKAEIEATCLILINLPVDRLAAIVKDEKAPLLFRATAKKLLSTDGYKAVLELIERAIGKAHQSIAANVSVMNLDAADEAVREAIKEYNLIGNG
jgi:hypothetical protein